MQIIEGVNIYRTDLIEDRLIGHITGFDLHVLKKDLFYEIIFSKFVLDDALELKKGENINFQLNKQHGFFLSLYVFEDTNLEKSCYFEKTILRADLTSPIARYSTNFYIRLIDSWSKEQMVYHWSNLALFQKRIWLEACMDRNDICTKISNPNKRILMECKRIKTKEDFFAYFGELFFGYSGYIGSNLDAMDDCLSQIENQNTCVLYLVDFGYLTSVLGYKYNKKYTDVILEVLLRRKISFKVKR